MTGPSWQLTHSHSFLDTFTAILRKCQYYCICSRRLHHRCLEILASSCPEFSRFHSSLLSSLNLASICFQLNKLFWPPASNTVTSFLALGNDKESVQSKPDPDWWFVPLVAQWMALSFLNVKQVCLPFPDTVWGARLRHSTKGPDTA